ncbi:Hypothetical protein KLENKIAIHU_3805, partial [Klenkia terrae]|jgi:hypothetical protein
VAEAIEVDVSDWETIQIEARGSGANQWRRDPNGVQWLYKATRRAAATGELQGEDWSEKAAERLASLIGVPCAEVELAHVRRGDGAEPGVVCKDLAEPSTEFQNGANLLADIPGYRYRDSRGRPPRNHVGHSVQNIVDRLRAFDVGPPTGASGVPTAVAALAGYLVLDAWIGNLDRHEENWAVLRDEDGVVTLAASYDHGAALGSSLTEARRAALAADSVGLAAYADKAFARKFEDGARVPLTAVAADALDQAGTAARAHWLSTLEAVELDDIRGALDGIPRMSDPARTFCEQLLVINRRRVLDDCR